MTQKEKIRESVMFAQRVLGITEDIRREGNDYDMQWHRVYCAQLDNMAKGFLNKLNRK